MLLTLGAVPLYQRFRGEFAGRAGGDPGTKVTLTIVAESSGARLTLRVDPRYLGLIPANVRADINASTVFGNKYVALRAPYNPVAQRLSPGGRVAGRRSHHQPVTRRFGAGHRDGVAQTGGPSTPALASRSARIRSVSSGVQPSGGATATHPSSTVSP